MFCRLAADDLSRNTKIKAIRQLLVTIGSKKPLEVLVGQSLPIVIGKTMPAENQFPVLSFVEVSAAKWLLQPEVTHA